MVQQDKSAWGMISRDEDNPLSYANKLRQVSVLEEVKEALKKKRVVMAYQPVVTARKPHNVAFHEGLIRILDKTGRIIPAGDFIQTVEATETGRLIDCTALEHGLKMLNKHQHLRLSINMSARSIGYMRWNRILDRALRKNPTIGERLILEITEQSAIVVPELVTGFMTDLQQKGVSFALDDFGSGFTSFHYLKEFYFDILKIDGAFIRNIARDVDNQIITKSIISLAEQFGMLCVAEHVEKSDDADYLISAGVDCMQGYFYGAPVIKPDWASKEDMVTQH